MLSKKMFSRVNFGITLAALTILLIVMSVSCSSFPEQTPEDFVKNFLEKHIAMIDASTADYYVKEEQAGITSTILKNIQTKKDEGNFESLKNAKYDFSDIRLKMLNQKQAYIDDEPKFFVEVEAKGFYTMTLDSKNAKIMEDEVFILLQVGDTWKVTENLNPWT